MVKYKIKLGREIINGILHIVVGIVITHTFLSPLSLWKILLILFLLGMVREFWQYKRNKIQPLYIQIIDVITIVIGGIIWWIIINYYNIQVDLL